MTLPLCQTLSKALLMSQKTTRISFPSSKAFPNSLLYDKLTQLHMTETDVEDVRQLLDTTKATGPDLINPRLVREGASIILSHRLFVRGVLNDFYLNQVVF
jgi:hypothetical protein